MTLFQWLMVHPYTRKLTKGQGLVEYALILVFVSVVLIALLTVLGPGIKGVYENIIRTL